MELMRSKGRCFKTLIYRYFGGMKGLLFDFAQKETLNLFWPLMKKKDNLENLKVSSRRDQRASKNVLAQEILRWQLIENNEEGLLSTSTQVGNILR
jgi:hypothetical protein